MAAAPAMAAPPPVAAPAPRQTPVTVITDSLVLVSPPVAASVASSPQVVVQTSDETPETPTVAEAQAWALAKLGKEQYACLDLIARNESRWNPLAWNRKGSGAYGIGQAKPASKMASFGADYMTNPITQVHWMIWYTDFYYGSPCGAAMWEFGWWYKGVWHPGAGWY